MIEPAAESNRLRGEGMRDIVKRYTRGDVTVVWQPGLCMHSEICFLGLPDVFDPSRRPWVDMEGADLVAIVEQVKRCPSGALSIGPMAVPSPPAPAPVVIEPQPNGPLLVRGDVDVRRADGTVERRTGSCALCRCGQSADRPFCDGTHKRVGFLA